MIFVYKNTQVVKSALDKTEKNVQLFDIAFSKATNGQKDIKQENNEH